MRQLLLGYGRNNGIGVGRELFDVVIIELLFELWSVAHAHEPERLAVAKLETNFAEALVEHDAQNGRPSTVEHEAQAIAVKGRRVHAEGAQVVEGLLKEVAPLCVVQRHAPVEKAIDSLHCATCMMCETGEEADSFHDVGCFLGVKVLGDLGSDEYQKRLGHVVGLQFRSLVVKEPELLVKGKNTACEVALTLFLLAQGRGVTQLKIENAIVFAEAVAVEPTVAVVEQDAAGIELHKFLALAAGGRIDRLHKRGRILEREAVFTEGCTPFHPVYSGHAAVSFINEHEV